MLLLEAKHPIDNTVLTILNYIFSNQQNVYIIPFSDTQIVLIHPYKSETPFKEQMRNICHTIIDTLNTEALIPVKISCSAPANHLHELHSAYEQALTTMRIGKRFHLEQPVFFYDELGASRLLYHIPDHICVDFLNEVWNNCIPTDPDPELISTINCFLYNNLNIAETARELHMHRNTLLYRIEKINNLTNLDIRNFTDAMTLKLALMIMKQNK